MLRFDTYYDAKPWGGRAFERVLGRRLPSGKIGEAWELSEMAVHHSRVVGGELAGETLGALWRGGRLGGSARGDFPVLLKWLDVEDWLSVQVHPDAAACARMGRGRPKTEAWLIAHAVAGASLLAGHREGLTADELQRMAEAQANAGSAVWHRWMHPVLPAAGDIVLLPAGTLHALGPGFLILEVQQPSDQTYRVYDWGRAAADGSQRALHLREAAISVRFDRPGPPQTVRERVVCDAFRLETLAVGRALEPGPLRILAAPSGDVQLVTQRGELVLHRGDVAVAQPEDGVVGVQHGTCVWISEGGSAAG